MGFEYQATIPDDSATWGQVVAAVNGLGEVETLSERRCELTFIFRDIDRDRTTWPEDGFLQLNASGLYLLINVGPVEVFVVLLEEALYDRGLQATFEQL